MTTKQIENNQSLSVTLVSDSYNKSLFNGGVIPEINEKMLRVFVKLTDTSAETKNNSIVIIVIDASKSMNNHKKLLHVQKSLEYFIDQMPTTTKLCLYTFNENVYPLTDDQCLNADLEGKTKCKSLINNIQTGPGTNIYLSFKKAIDIAEQVCTEEKLLTHILYLTDGKNTTRLKQSLLKSGLKKLDINKNIIINTIGYGNECNHTFLKLMAKKTNGEYCKVNNSKNLIESLANFMDTFLNITKHNISIVTTINTKYSIEKTNSSYYSLNEDRDKISKFPLGSMLIKQNIYLVIVYRINEANIHDNTLLTINVSYNDSDLITEQQNICIERLISNECEENVNNLFDNDINVGYLKLLMDTELVLNEQLTELRNLPYSQSRLMTKFGNVINNKINDFLLSGDVAYKFESNNNIFADISHDLKKQLRKFSKQSKNDGDNDILKYLFQKTAKVLLKTKYLKPTARKINLF